MVFNNILSHIYSSKSNVIVLRVLINIANGLSGREVARRCGLTPKTTHKVLSYLLDYGIVERQNGNTEHLFKLNNQNWIVNKIIKPSFEAENEFLKDISVFIVKQTANYCTKILLFGSVARKEEELNSDLDICFIVREESIKEKLEDKLLGITEKIKKVFGANLSPIFFTAEEFRSQKKKQIVNNILNDGVILYRESLIGQTK